MANPTYFTVVADFKSVVVDLASDVDPDPQLGPVTAKVTFTPVLANGDVILASSASPRPTIYVPAQIVARIDTDGRLKLRVAPDGDRDDYANRAAFPATGNTAKVYFAIDTQTFYRWNGSTYVETYPYAQVRLLADTALLSLASDLYYRVTFSEVIFNGAPGYINSFTFQAPKTDVEVNLVNLARVPGQPAAGITKGDKGDRGYSFAGLAPAGDGSSVVGLIESPNGLVATGDPIPISLAYNSTVTHGTVASTARPPVSVAVIWIGSVEPTYAIDGDVWLDTTGNAPSVTTTVLGSLNQYAQTSQTLIASGSTPIVWSVSAGTLPAGLSLSTEGNLYGSPTATGSYSFTVKALNAFGYSTRALTGTVGSAIAPTISTTSLGSITSGIAFSLTLSSSGSSPITYAVQSGSLPTGLTLNASTGVISGTATTVGSYTFTIRATNAAGYDDQAFTGSVSGVAPTITTTSLGTIYRAFAVSKTLTSTGTTPITYAVQSGSLPAGLSLNTSSGLISGTPTTVASYSFTISATNAYGTDNKAFTGSVLQSTPAITQTSLNSLSIGIAFTQTLTVTTGGPTITWSVLSGTLPAGLLLNSSTGTIAGTPTTAAAYSVTIRATNGTENSDRTFTGSVVNPAVVFDAASAEKAALASSSSFSFTASAGADVFVGITTAYFQTGTVSSITYNGAAMSLVAKLNHGGRSDLAQNGVTYLYRASGAGTGSAAAVLVNFNVSLYSVMGAVSYRNVSTLGTVVSTSGSSTSASTGSVTCASSGVVLSVIGGGSTAYTALNSSSGGNLRVSGVSDPVYAQLVMRDDSTTNTFSATFGASQLWSCLAVPLNP